MRGLANRASTLVGTLATVTIGLAVGSAAAPADPGWLTRATGLAPPRAPVIFLGVPGLRWADVSKESMPTLYGLINEAAVASLSVRTVGPLTCPADGWLTLGTGARAVAPRTPTDSDQPGCRAPQANLDPAGRGQAMIPDHPAIVAANDEYSYDPDLGLLGREIRATGRCATAIGPGAALALADQDGRAAPYRPELAHLGRDVLESCALTVVDLGSLPAAEARTTAVQAADRAIATIVAERPPGATVIVAGLADSGPVPHLGALAIAGPGYSGGWLTAASTRQDGLVQLTDLTPTVLDLLDLDRPARAVGAPISTTGDRHADSGAAVQRLRGADVAAQTIRRSGGAVFGALEGGQYLLYLLVGGFIGWQARRGRRPTTGVRALGTLALLFSAVPAASTLANLAPWWRAGRPLVALLLALAVAAFAVTALALAGPWRRHPLGPPGFVAAVTVVVLTADVVTGSRLQLSSLFGLSPLVAGRFYGFGNIAFAVFAMAALFSAVVLASYLLRRGERRAAVLAVGMVGLLAVVVDGWPGWGADFGGVVALVPGFAVLGLAVAQARITPLRIAGVGVAALGAVGVLAFLDWLRPAGQRSHLGRFVQQILDGAAGEVVVRKASDMVHSLTVGPQGVLVPLALLGVGLTVANPVRARARWLADAYAADPVLRAGLIAMLVTAIVGALVNDSGVQVPAVCLALAVPLVLASCARVAASAPPGRAG